MTTHAIVTMKINAPDRLAAYRDRAADALAKHGGSVLQASGDLELLEGIGEVPDVAAILSFPDRQSATAWINDTDLQDVHALRQASGDTVIFLL